MRACENSMRPHHRADSLGPHWPWQFVFLASSGVMPRLVDWEPHSEKPWVRFSVYFPFFSSLESSASSSPLPPPTVWGTQECWICSLDPTDRVRWIGQWNISGTYSLTKAWCKTQPDYACYWPKCFLRSPGSELTSFAGDTSGWTLIWVREHGWSVIWTLKSLPGVPLVWGDDHGCPRYWRQEGRGADGGLSLVPLSGSCSPPRVSMSGSCRWSAKGARIYLLRLNAWNIRCATGPGICDECTIKTWH
jgi:hypothetical protein